MASNEVEITKLNLEEDLMDNPHVLSAPLAHGVTRQKICKYLYACVLSGISQDDCVDWLCDLYKKQNDDEQHQFHSILHTVAVALYEFKKYINVNKSK